MFDSRVDAGRRLAAELARREWHDPIVFGIPRGGVVVAAEVAAALDAPLAVAPAAKVGAPSNPEYAIGAVAPDGEVTVNPTSGFVASEVREWSGTAMAKVRHELDAFGAPPDIHGREALVIDDGLATGITAMTACDWLKRMGAARVVLAIPVASEGAMALLRSHADEVIALDVPRDFYAVGQFYRAFGQTEDVEVLDLLAKHRGAQPEGRFER